MALRVCIEDGCPVLTTTTRCTECTRKLDQARGTTRERGYGKHHVRLRARWQRRLDQGELVLCWRCGDTIDPDHWHLGHNDHDRNTYNGPECVPCNLAVMSPGRH